MGRLPMITFSEFLTEIIDKENGKYVVKSKDRSKVLGTHKSKKKAQAQLAAIEISKQKGK